MVTAKAFGMKVTRYFVGFGPTLWSFTRGETEYGVKAHPARRLRQDRRDDAAGRRRRRRSDEPRAMWRFPVWKRTIVMAAGSITHFILGVRHCCGSLFVVRRHREPEVRRAGPATAARPINASGRTSQVDDGAAAATPTATVQPATTRPAQPGRACSTGDKIIAVNGDRRCTTTADADRRRSGRSPARPSTVTYVRDGRPSQPPVEPASRRARSADRRPERHRRSTTSRARRRPGRSAPASPAERDATAPVDGVGHGRHADRQLVRRARSRRSSSPGEGPGAVDAITAASSATRTPRSASSAPAGSAARLFEHGQWADVPAACSPR